MLWWRSQAVYDSLYWSGNCRELERGLSGTATGIAQRGCVRTQVVAVTVLALVMNALRLCLGQRARQALGIGLRIAGFWVGLFWGDGHRRGRHRVVSGRNNEPPSPSVLGGSARA